MYDSAVAADACSSAGPSRSTSTQRLGVGRRRPRRSRRARRSRRGAAASGCPGRRARSSFGGGRADAERCRGTRRRARGPRDRRRRGARSARRRRARRRRAAGAAPPSRRAGSPRPCSRARRAPARAPSDRRSRRAPCSTSGIATRPRSSSAASVAVARGSAASASSVDRASSDRRRCRPCRCATSAGTAALPATRSASLAARAAWSSARGSRRACASRPRRPCPRRACRRSGRARRRPSRGTRRCRCRAARSSASIASIAPSRPSEPTAAVRTSSSGSFIRRISAGTADWSPSLPIARTAGGAHVAARCRRTARRAGSRRADRRAPRAARSSRAGRRPCRPRAAGSARSRRVALPRCADRAERLAPRAGGRSRRSRRASGSAPRSPRCRRCRRARRPRPRLIFGVEVGEPLDHRPAPPRARRPAPSALAAWWRTFSSSSLERLASGSAWVSAMSYLPSSLTASSRFAASSLCSPSASTLDVAGPVERPAAAGARRDAPSSPSAERERLMSRMHDREYGAPVSGFASSASAHWTLARTRCGQLELEQRAVLGGGAGRVAALPVQRRERDRAAGSRCGASVRALLERGDRARDRRRGCARSRPRSCHALGVGGVAATATLELRDRLGRLAPGHERLGVLAAGERDARRDRARSRSRAR